MKPTKKLLRLTLELNGMIEKQCASSSNPLVRQQFYKKLKSYSDEVLKEHGYFAKESARLGELLQSSAADLEKAMKVTEDMASFLMERGLEEEFNQYIREKVK